MKGLTIRQPWAWAIAAGLKAVENRTWPTRHRGPLAIHAGRTPCPAGLVLPDGTPVRDAELIYGALIATAELAGCLPLAEAPPGPFTEGPWCWLLSDVRPITPVAWRGQQFLFDIPDMVIARQTP